MDDSRDFDLDQMMDRIRSNVHDQRRQEEAGPAPSNERPVADYAEQQRDISTLHAAYDISGSPMKLDRKVLGRVLKRAVSFVNELLWPTLRRQSEYNAANTRLTDFLKRQAEWLAPDYVEFRDQTKRTLAADRAQFKAQLEAAYQRFAKLHTDDSAMRGQALSELAQRVGAGERLDRDYQRQLQTLEMLERRGAELRQQLDSYSGAMRELVQRVEALAQQHQLLEQHERRLDALDSGQAQFTQSFEAMRQAQAKNESQAHNRDQELQAMRMRLSRAERRLRQIGVVDNGRAVAALAEPPAPPLALAEIDYAGFEDLLRNSETIRNKQRGYLTYFTGSGPVIDVGCGRGEFLELMREAGIDWDWTSTLT
ncbi:MAG: hypothetical protein ACLQU2_16790 [Candidatus Binataceae bacterium]